MTPEPRDDVPDLSKVTEIPPRDRSSVDLSTDFRDPDGELQQMLAGLWSTTLAVEPVGADDDFFELGGHSLLAAELLTRVQQLTGTEVSATTLFLEPTIAELAVAIERHRELRREASECTSPR